METENDSFQKGSPFPRVHFLGATCEISGLIKKQTFCNRSANRPAFLPSFLLLPRMTLRINSSWRWLANHAWHLRAASWCFQMFFLLHVFSYPGSPFSPFFKGGFMNHHVLRKGIYMHIYHHPKGTTTLRNDDWLPGMDSLFVTWGWVVSFLRFYWWGRFWWQFSLLNWEVIHLKGMKGWWIVRFGRHVK